MALIHSDFNFLDKPWWQPDYDDRNAQYFISNTGRLQRSISLSVDSEDKLFFLGYIDLHLERYLIECISAEGDIDLEVIRQLLNKSWFKVFLSYISEIMFPRIIFGPSRSSHLAKKV